MIFALALSICACFTFAPGIASQEFLDNNPELRDYQDEEECFPFNETWYEVYRNFESDPYFGGNGTCIRTTETGPYTNGSTTAIAQFSPNVSLDVILTLVSTPGYDVKNTINVESTTDPSIALNLTVAYRDCENCKIFRHSYINSGQGCSYWVPESKLGVNNSCCEFIFDLLCGTSPKYQIYQNCSNGA
ncbi:uncharacterized protein LOC144121800 [Amblyomma americanum]